MLFKNTSILVPFIISISIMYSGSTGRKSYTKEMKVTIALK